MRLPRGVRGRAWALTRPDCWQARWEDYLLLQSIWRHLVTGENVQGETGAEDPPRNSLAYCWSATYSDSSARSPGGDGQ